MTNTPQTRLKNMGEVEQLVMDYIWTHGPSSSEACREALASSRPMKDSTIRTVLRRLEEKGYLTHETEGRTFIYGPLTRARTSPCAPSRASSTASAEAQPNNSSSAWWTTPSSTANNSNASPAKSRNDNSLQESSPQKRSLQKDIQQEGSETMTPHATVPASQVFSLQLANPAARALALASPRD